MVCMQAVLLGVSGAMHALKLQSAPTHRDTVLPCRACRRGSCCLQVHCTAQALKPGPPCLC